MEMGPEAGRQYAATEDWVGRLPSDRGRRSRTGWMVSSIWAFGVLLACALLALDRQAPAGRPVIKVGGPTDISNYYSVAHSLLFDHDFDLSNQYRRLHVVGDDLPQEKYRWKEVQPQTDLPGSPYPIGSSLLQVPFLFVGSLAERILYGHSDGYSHVAVTFYYFGILFWLCLGLTLLFLLLRALGRSLGASPRRCDWAAWIGSLALWPTTSLAYYSFSAMSHVAAFMASCAFLLAWWHARDSTSLPRWLLCGACAGLLVMCRWQMALFMIIPVLYDAFLFPRAGLLPAGKWLASRCVAVVALYVAFLPQTLQWKAIYNKFLTLPQGADFFDFPARHALHVLFSTNHGWFVWTPITLVGVVGLLYGCFRLTRLCVPFSVALALQVLLIGSLRTDWNASESFSIRTLTECLPLVGVGLGLLLFRGPAFLRRCLYGAGAMCAVYTLLFAVQYRLDLVPKGDRLTAGELIVDKLFLARAAQRKSASLEASRMLASDARKAAELAYRAGGQLGYDREILKVILESEKRRGSPRAIAQAQASLDKVLKSRLF